MRNFRVASRKRRPRSGSTWTKSSRTTTFCRNLLTSCERRTTKKRVTPLTFSGKRSPTSFLTWSLQISGTITRKKWSAVSFLVTSYRSRWAPRQWFSIALAPERAPKTICGRISKDNWKRRMDFLRIKSTLSWLRMVSRWCLGKRFSYQRREDPSKVASKSGC